MNNIYYTHYLNVRLTNVIHFVYRVLQKINIVVYIIELINNKV